MDLRVPVEEFNAALWRRFHNGKIRNVYPLIKYNDIIEKIKTMEENPPCNTPGEYYLLRKFIVVMVNGKERLSCKPENCILSENSQNRSTPTKFYVALEEIYSYLEEAHRWVKHGCRDRLVRKIQSQGIVNITRDTVELFLSFCKFCRPSNRKTTKQILKSEHKTVISANLQFERASNSPLSDINSENDTDNPSGMYDPSTVGTINIEMNTNRSSARTVCTFTRGFIDLIDYSFAPDGEYRYAFLYLDIQTCFCVLYPVRCKCTFEIVSHLLSVFTLIGSPQVLHSNFENSFLSTIICDLKKSLPDLILVSGSTNYSEVQEVAQNCTSEVNCMLKAWMFENSSSHWSYGLKLVQLKKNTKLPGNSTKSPYECFFGRTMNSNLLPTIDVDLLKNAEKEDDLLSFINEQPVSEQQPCEHLQVSLDPDVCSLVQNHEQRNAEMIDTKNDQIQLPVIKSEPVSDSEIQETNGFECSDLSNDESSSPNGNLEVMGFGVVFFLKTDKVSVISKKWMIDKYTCMWPPTDIALEVKEAILEHKAPDDTWKKYDVVLMDNKYYHDYNEAIEKAELAMDTTSSDSDCANVKKAKPRKRHRKRLESYDSDSPPPRHKRNTSILSPHVNVDKDVCLSSKTSGHQPPRPSHLMISVTSPSCIVPGPSHFRQHADSESSARLSDLNSLSSPTRSSQFSENQASKSLDVALNKDSPTAVERRMIKIIEELKADITSVATHISSILGKPFVSENVLSVPDLMPSLPISTFSDLQKWEEFLSDKIKFDECVKYFSTKVGSHRDYNQSTRRLLCEMFTNDFAQEFNWAGRPPKKAFKDLKMQILIVSSMKNNTVGMDLPINQIENTIKDWLKHALFRANYRKKSLCKISMAEM